LIISVKDKKCHIYLSFDGRNVGKNNLTGLVPSGLLERSKTGSLSLRYTSYSKLYQFILYSRKRQIFNEVLFSSCNVSNNIFSKDN
jgi:hypothetical protein